MVDGVRMMDGGGAMRPDIGPTSRVLVRTDDDADELRAGVVCSTSGTGTNGGNGPSPDVLVVPPVDFVPAAVLLRFRLLLINDDSWSEPSSDDIAPELVCDT